MSTKARPTGTELPSNDPLMEEFHRGQQSARLKGIVALVVVALGIAFLFYGFVQMASV